MKQDLWLANSSLLLLFVLSIGIYELLQQEPPVWKEPKISSSAEAEKRKTTSFLSGSWDKIFQEDIFGTYVPSEAKAVKQSLITPIPEPKPPILPPPPEIKKQEFIPALNITLRGIIATGDEQRNVAMIADETNKEGMYHLGEKIKDAQIIKIAHNRVVLLRANGQEEVFYLRKDEIPDDQTIIEKWKFIVRKINDQTYDVDPFEFAKEIETLGLLISRAGVIGGAYAAGKPIGIKLGKINQQDVSHALGFMENDIITTIDDLDISDANNRIKVYENIIHQPLGKTVKVGIKRANKDISILYKLAKIERPRKSIFPGVKIAQPQAQAPVQEDAFKLNRLQQREQAMRDFSRHHADEQQRQQSMVEIRRRILEGLQQRYQNNHIR